MKKRDKRVEAEAAKKAEENKRKMEEGKQKILEEKKKVGQTSFFFSLLLLFAESDPLMCLSLLSASSRGL